MKSSISVLELEQLIETEPSLQLVDVRSAGEYASGHVPRALNIPLEQLEARVSDLGAGRVAILCQTGDRASLACGLLESRHPNLLLVKGGTDAWVSAGKPVSRSTTTKWALERQVRLLAGLIVLMGTVLSLVIAPGWVYVAMFVGAGLTLSGLTNFCGMALLLGKLPWNRSTQSDKKLTEIKT